MDRRLILSTAVPIQFSPEMTKAVRDNKKTVMRLLIKENTEYPKLKAGDILYLRERWGYRYCWECRQQGIVEECDFEGYKLDNALFGEYGCYIFPDEVEAPVDHQWHAALRMPKEAARTFLRVTSVKVEHLQEIIEGDKTVINICREGLIDPCNRCTYLSGKCKDLIAQNSCRLVSAYIERHNNTVKSCLNKYGWAANPLVAVVTFKMIPEEQLVIW